MAKKTVKKVVKTKPVKLSPELITKSFNELSSIVLEMEPDVIKFTDQSVASAGRRLRGHAQAIRKLLGQFRKDIQALVIQNKTK